MHLTSVCSQKGCPAEFDTLGSFKANLFHNMSSSETTGKLFGDLSHKEVQARWAKEKARKQNP
jgi:hypothetical protein